MRRLLCLLLLGVVWLAPLMAQAETAEALARTLAERLDGSELEAPEAAPADALLVRRTLILEESSVVWLFSGLDALPSPITALFLSSESASVTSAANSNPIDAFLPRLSAPWLQRFLF